MNGMKVELTCPLGHKCETASGDTIHRCTWFTQIAGQNPTTGEQIDEKGCAMAWLPILLVENARVARGTSAAVETFRNEMVAANLQALPLMQSQRLKGPN